MVLLYYFPERLADVNTSLFKGFNFLLEKITNCFHKLLRQFIIPYLLSLKGAPFIFKRKIFDLHSHGDGGDLEESRRNLPTGLPSSMSVFKLKFP